MSETSHRMTAEKFWAQVDIRGPEECWPWKGKASRPRGGYGITSWAGRKKFASRVAWIIANQITPPRHLHVCHDCNNPPCCNPSHLSLGTITDNNRYITQSGRHWAQRMTHCRKGHPFDLVCRRKDGTTYRSCKQCQGERSRRNWPQRSARRKVLEQLKRQSNVSS